MTQEEISKAFIALNHELQNLNVRGEILIMGGAVMCLVFNTRNSTQDIDAIMIPTDVIQKAAFNVSETLGLENSFWINDAVQVFNSKSPEFSLSPLSLSNLIIYTASAQYMFAMKLLSARSGTNDETDLIFLKDHLNLKSELEALVIIEKFYPEHKLSIESKTMLKDLFTP